MPEFVLFRLVILGLAILQVLILDVCVEDLSPPRFRSRFVTLNDAYMALIPSAVAWKEPPLDLNVAVRLRDSIRLKCCGAIGSNSRSRGS
jgi:hypothetical protein